MAMWNPWRGCHKCSEGCQLCYIHKGDQRRGLDTNRIVRLPGFDAPVAKTASGAFKMKPDQTVYLCFSSDFLLEEADAWRPDCWRMMRQRPDLHFLFLTKRIHRLAQCLPEDWGDGWDNVTVCCTVENQRRADERLPLFASVPLKHRQIICQPMLGPIDLSAWLEGVEAVVVGGESDTQARPLDYAWVLALREQCLARDVRFTFRQCGTHFIKDGKAYTLNVRELTRQARLAGIDC
ncbi:MAG: phage Gp37/Gp68 family protein [Clostridiales bacterium]|nr:phage Gp37/Gp68 family protein [Clostridiales bacterium]